jgi:hypothetical protein
MDNNITEIRENPKEMDVLDFDIPFSDDKNLVRLSITNTFKNSFIHCILWACSNEYNKLKSEEDKKKFVMKFFLGIEPILKIKHWKRLSKKIEIIMNFQDIFKTNIKELYDYFLYNKDIQNPNLKELVLEIIKRREEKEIYKIIFEIVDSKNMENNIIPHVFKKCSGINIQKSIPIIQEKTVSYSKKLFDSFGESIEDNKKKYCLERLDFLIKKILSLSESMCMDKNMDFLKKRNLQINDITIDMICKIINRDIYFIDYKNSLPVVIGKVIIENRKSIVLLKFENSFEILGTRKKGEISKEFNSGDPMIIKIKNFISDPQLFKKNYPKLKKYLEYKSDIIRKRSCSESSSSEEDD